MARSGGLEGPARRAALLGVWVARANRSCKAVELGLLPSKHYKVDRVRLAGRGARHALPLAVARSVRGHASHTRGSGAAAQKLFTIDTVGKANATRMYAYPYTL